MKRVWNIVNPSIYSLSSFNNEGEQNFNICSYVSVVSLKPKLYMIAIEKTSKTHSNLSKSSSCILQILSIDNINLIKVETAEEMFRATQKNLPTHIAVFSAAVSDFKVKKKKEL